MRTKGRLEVKAIELPATELWRKKKSAVNNEFWIFLRQEKGIPFNLSTPPFPINLKMYCV